MLSDYSPSGLVTCKIWQQYGGLETRLSILKSCEAKRPCDADRASQETPRVLLQHTVASIDLRPVLLVVQGVN